MSNGESNPTLTDQIKSDLAPGDGGVIDRSEAYDQLFSLLDDGDGESQPVESDVAESGSDLVKAIKARVEKMNEGAVEQQANQVVLPEIPEVSEPELGEIVIEPAGVQSQVEPPIELGESAGEVHENPNEIAVDPVKSGSDLGEVAVELVESESDLNKSKEFFEQQLKEIEAKISEVEKILEGPLNVASDFSLISVIGEHMAVFNKQDQKVKGLKTPGQIKKALKTRLARYKKDADDCRTNIAGVDTLSQADTVQSGGTSHPAAAESPAVQNRRRKRNKVSATTITPSSDEPESGGLGQPGSAPESDDDLTRQKNKLMKQIDDLEARSIVIWDIIRPSGHNPDGPLSDEQRQALIEEKQNIDINLVPPLRRELNVVLHKIQQPAGLDQPATEHAPQVVERDWSLGKELVSDYDWDKLETFIDEKRISNYPSPYMSYQEMAAFIATCRRASADDKYWQSLDFQYGLVNFDRNLVFLHGQTPQEHEDDLRRISQEIEGSSLSQGKKKWLKEKLGKGLAKIFKDEEGNLRKSVRGTLYVLLFMGGGLVGYNLPGVGYAGGLVGGLGGVALNSIAYLSRSLADRIKSEDSRLKNTLIGLSGTYTRWGWAAQNSFVRAVSGGLLVGAIGHRIFGQTHSVTPTFSETNQASGVGVDNTTLPSNDSLPVGNANAAMPAGPAGGEPVDWPKGPVHVLPQHHYADGISGLNFETPSADPSVSQNELSNSGGFIDSDAPDFNSRPDHLQPNPGLVDQHPAVAPDANIGNATGSDLGVNQVADVKSVHGSIPQVGEAPALEHSGVRGANLPGNSTDVSSHVFQPSTAADSVGSHFSDQANYQSDGLPVDSTVNDQIVDNHHPDRGLISKFGAAHESTTDVLPENNVASGSESPASPTEIPTSGDGSQGETTASNIATPQVESSVLGVDGAPLETINIDNPYGLWGELIGSDLGPIGQAETDTVKDVAQMINEGAGNHVDWNALGPNNQFALVNRVEDLARVPEGNLTGILPGKDVIKVLVDWTQKGLPADANDTVRGVFDAIRSGVQGNGTQIVIDNPGGVAEFLKKLAETAKGVQAGF